MIRRFVSTAIVFLLASTSATTQELEPDSARLGLTQFAQSLSSLNARFNQVVISSEGRVESEGSGEVWMMTPDRFRWSYEGDFPELIVADGVNVWQYDEMLEQVTVRAQSEQAGNSPLLLLSDPSGLEDQFIATELGDYEGAQLLSLQSRDPDSEFERILLGFRDNSLVLMGMEDAFGMRTELHFEQMTRNPELDPTLFEFIPPDDVDMVGEPDSGS